MREFDSPHFIYLLKSSLQNSKHSQNKQTASNLDTTIPTTTNSLKPLKTDSTLYFSSLAKTVSNVNTHNSDHNKLTQLIFKWLYSYFRSPSLVFQKDKAILLVSWSVLFMKIVSDRSEFSLRVNSSTEELWQKKFTKEVLLHPLYEKTQKITEQSWEMFTQRPMVSKK